jgi:hypothetical protein
MTHANLLLTFPLVTSTELSVRNLHYKNRAARQRSNFSNLPEREPGHASPPPWARQPTLGLLVQQGKNDSRETKSSAIHVYPLYICVCMCACMCAYVHVCMHEYVCMYVYVCGYVCARIYICVYCVCVCIVSICVCVTPTAHGEIHLALPARGETSGCFWWRS